MKTVWACCILVLITTVNMSPLRAQTADQQLEAFFTNHLEECFKIRPSEATMLGDHRF